MSNLGNLPKKTKKLMIGNIEVEIKPRTMKDLDMIINLQKEETQSTAIWELIKRTLQEALPDATDEEIQGIPFEYFKSISEAVMEVNGLNATTA